MSENNTKNCPYCGEEIKSSAIKCRYCGEDLTTPEAKKLLEKQEKEKQKKELQKKLENLKNINREKINKYPKNLKIEISQDINFLEKLQNFSDEDIKKDIEKRRKNHLLIIIIIIGIIIASISTLLFFLYISLAIWFYPNKNFKELKNIKQHKIKFIFSLIFFLIFLFNLPALFTDSPTIKILSTLDNGTSKEYLLKVKTENANKISINGILYNLSGSLLEKKFIINNTKLKLNLIAKNKYKETEKEITIIRHKTKKEIELERKIKEEQLKRKQEELKKKQEAEKKKKEEEEKCMKDKFCRSLKLKEKNEKYLKEHGGTEFWIFCKRSMREMLKSPSTADFPWTADNVYTAGEYIFVVGHVDAQNSFGAMLRTKFSCKFEFKNGVYTLTDISTN